MNRCQQVESVSRCAVFVDVYNMFSTTKHLHNAKLNYANVLKILSIGRDIVNATAYLAYKPDIDSKSFEESLKKMGFDIKRKTDQEFGDGDKKRVKFANWELGMSIDMIKWASKVDTIVVVSGNGAFVETFTYLKSMPVRLEIAGFPQMTSTALKSLADDFIDLGDKDLSENCLIHIGESNQYVGLPVDEEVAVK